MRAIYVKVHGGQHFLIATATSNLASVFSARKDCRRAEPLFREALQMYIDTQGRDHLNTGIAHLKLGTLLRQGHYMEAEPETSAGYAIVQPTGNALGELSPCRA